MTHLMVQIALVWLLAILAGVPLFAAMGLAAFAFVGLGGLSLSIVPQKMAQAMNSFPIVAAPLFILMGNILAAARINEKIIGFATSIVGWLRGGYAHASIVASTIWNGAVPPPWLWPAGPPIVAVATTLHKMIGIARIGQLHSWGKAAPQGSSGSGGTVAGGRRCLVACS